MAKRFRIPKEFDLGCQKIEVIKTDTLVTEEGALGLYRHGASMIEIQPTNNGIRIKNDALALTFFHEKIHALLMTLNTPESMALNAREEQVDLLANLLWQSIKTEKY